MLLKSLGLSIKVVLVCFTPCSSQMVGVMVRLEKEAFEVLTQHGKELHVPQHTVQKRNNRAVALDMNQISLTHLCLHYCKFVTISFWKYIEFHLCSRYC